jgi:hypothetical protein
MDGINGNGWHSLIDGRKEERKLNCLCVCVSVCLCVCVNEIPTLIFYVCMLSDVSSLIWVQLMDGRHKWTLMQWTPLMDRRH